jgi:hypothetical protein
MSGSRFLLQDRADNMTPVRFMVLLFSVFVVAAVFGCSPTRQHLERRPSLEEVRGYWRNEVGPTAGSSVPEVRLFHGGMSSVMNLPVYIPSRGDVQIVSGEGSWEVFPRESLDAKVQWVVMVQITNLKMRFPFYVMKEGNQMFLDYSTDPELTRGLEFKRVTP